MSREVGNSFEELALSYLLNHGLALIERNFNSRFGELDLIMQDKDTTVFVEVRKRKGGLDEANYSINYSKQSKLVKAANYYCLKIGYDINCRFDAVLIDDNSEIEWLQNIIVLY